MAFAAMLCMDPITVVFTMAVRSHLSEPSSPGFRSPLRSPPWPVGVHQWGDLLGSWGQSGELLKSLFGHLCLMRGREQSILIF